MSDVQATPATSTAAPAATTTTAAAASTLYYEYSAAATPQLPIYTGRSFTTDSPNTTTVAPPAVTDDTLIQYWINGAWFVGKKESEITAGQLNKYIADVVYTRSNIRSTQKMYPQPEVATFEAQYQAALAVKAGQTSDLITQLAAIRSVTPADMATVIISKHDSAIASQVAFAKATYGLQALASEALTLDAALAGGLIELYPLLQYLNNPAALSHKILSMQGAANG